MYKKILVPLDGSQLAEAALPHAQALAKAEGAEIILLRVPVLPTTAFLARDPALASMVLKEMEDETKEYMQDEVLK
jgi:nucleotide-binding universal stress UspA family protein